MNVLDNNRITIHSDVPNDQIQYLDAHPEMFELANIIVNRICSIDETNNLEIGGMFFVPEGNSNNLILDIKCNNQIIVARIEITNDGKFKFHNRLLVDPSSFISSEEGWKEILSSIHYDRHISLEPMSNEERRFINNIPHFSTPHIHQGRANKWQKGIGHWLT